MDKKELANFIERHGLTSEQLARLIGVSSHAVSSYRCGRTPVPEPVARLLVLLEKNGEINKTKRG